MVALGLESGVTALLGQGYNIEERDGSGNTPAMRAIMNNDMTMLQILMEHGANIHDHHAGGYTPLYTAMRMGRTEIVKFLLQRLLVQGLAGIALNLENEEGETPLSFFEHNTTGMEIDEEFQEMINQAQRQPKISLPIEVLEVNIEHNNSIIIIEETQQNSDNIITLIPNEETRPFTRSMLQREILNSITSHPML